MFVAPTTKPAEIETKTGTGNESESENKQELKTETKNGETKIDIRSNGVRIRFETKDGKLVIKKENEEGQQEDVNKNEQAEVENELENNDVRVATTSGNAIMVSKNGVGARTNLPLSVDPVTHELFVQTPQEIRLVAVLPDAVAGLLLSKNILSQLNTTKEAQTELTEQNGKLVFKATGVKNERLLGIFPVKFQKTVVLSAETGQVLEEEKSFQDRLVDIFSF